MTGFEHAGSLRVALKSRRTAFAQYLLQNIRSDALRIPKGAKVKLISAKSGITAQLRPKASSHDW